MALLVRLTVCRLSSFDKQISDALHCALCVHVCLCLLLCVLRQVYSELSQYQSLRFLDPLGSLLDGCSTVVDEAAAAAATPAFMCGAVLLPLMDILMCQVR